MKSLGFLALMSSRLPSEIFDDNNWPETLLFNMRVSNLLFSELIPIMAGKMGFK